MDSWSILTDSSVLGLWINWAGVVIAVVGLILTSPQGSKKLWRAFVQKIVRAWKNLISHVLFWRRKEAEVGPVRSSSGTASATASAVSTTAHGLAPDVGVEEKVRQLEKRLEAFERSTRDSFLGVQTSISRITEDVGRVEELYGVSRSESRAERVRADQATANLQAVGLPVIGAGIILSGIPSELAAYPVVGWAAIVVGAAVTVWFFCYSITQGLWMDPPQAAPPDNGTG